MMFGYWVLYMNTVDRENSTTKSANTCPFIELLGLYLISKDSSWVPHLAIQPVKSNIFNSDCKGYLVNTYMV